MMCVRCRHSMKLKLYYDYYRLTDEYLAGIFLIIARLIIFMFSSISSPMPAITGWKVWSTRRGLTFTLHNLSFLFLILRIRWSSSCVSEMCYAKIQPFFWTIQIRSNESRLEGIIISSSHESKLWDRCTFRADFAVSSLQSGCYQGLLILREVNTWFIFKRPQRKVDRAARVLLRFPAPGGGGRTRPPLGPPVKQHQWPRMTLFGVEPLIVTPGSPLLRCTRAKTSK